MKILWIAGWYPNQLEPYTGDFVQRHAKAVSLYHNVHVVFVARDAVGTVTNSTRIEEYKQGQLSEERIYYKNRLPAIPVIDKFISQLTYTRLLKRSIKKYIAQNGKPALVHFYIGMKPCVVGSWIKKRLGIPYLVSEQWTGFLEEGIPHFRELPVWLQWKWKGLVRNAAGVHVVSAYLGNAIRQLAGQNIPLKIIPNVVDTNIFLPVPEQENDPVKFVHVTGGLGYQKNTEDILQAFAILNKDGIKVQLRIFGVLREELARLASELGIENSVVFHGEISQPELSDYFQHASALIIYSRFETFGCVVIEAQACGAPVIASDIPVLHEIVHEGINGLFVKGTDPVALAKKMDWFIRHRGQFNKQAIANESAEKYNYKKVGKLFSEWYASILADPGKHH